MEKQVLFIHGGGPGLYEADGKLVDSLRNALGAEYNVVYPKMPKGEAPEYAIWKAQISKELASLNSKLILVGHSLGGSVLLKYLSEEDVTEPIAGVFLIASPFWGAEDWQVNEYILREDFASHLPKGMPISLYHSHDDEVVPFAHLAMYAEKLPQATMSEFDGRGHQFNDDLSEVATDIVGLQNLQQS